MSWYPVIAGWEVSQQETDHERQQFFITNRKAASTGVEQGQTHRTKAAVAARARVVDPSQVAIGAPHARLDALQPGDR
jgi:hypothetical protein